MPPRRDLTLFEKIQIIELVQNGKSVKECMNVFKVGKTQIYSALKRKEELFREFESGKSDYKKLHRGPKDENLTVDERTFECLKSCLDRNIPITGPMLQAKAKEIALEVGLADFKASNGWLDCFKRRHGINWKALMDRKGDDERKYATVNQFFNQHAVYSEVNTSTAYETNSKEEHQCVGVKMPNETREGADCGAVHPLQNMFEYDANQEILEGSLLGEDTTTLRRELTLLEKMRVIELVRGGKSVKECVKLLGLGKSQIHCTLKRKADIIQEFESGKAADCKRINQGTKDLHLLIDEKTFEWYLCCSTRHMSITESMLRARAKEIALDLGVKDFKASLEWCEGFKRRHRISLNAARTPGSPTSLEMHLHSKLPTGNQTPGDCEKVSPNPSYDHSHLKESSTPCLGTSEPVVVKENEVEEQRLNAEVKVEGVDGQPETSGGRRGEEEKEGDLEEFDVFDVHTRGRLVKSLEDGVFALKDIQKFIEEKGLMDLKTEILKFRRLYEQAVAKHHKLDHTC